LTGNGGGVYVSDGTVTFQNCDIHNNEAYDGGGIYVTGGNARLVSSSIHTNTVTNTGANVYVSTTGSVCTFAMSLTGVSGTVSSCPAPPPPLPVPPSLPPQVASPSSAPHGATLELTGDAPRIIFGEVDAPVCELMLDRSHGRLESTCAIASTARRLDEEEEDADWVKELNELKVEVAKLRSSENECKEEIAELRRTVQVVADKLSV